MKHSKFKILTSLLVMAAVLDAPLHSFGDITATVYPGYQFSPGERPTTATLNDLGTPTIVISGTLGGTNVALAAGSVTGTMLSGTVVDGVTVDFNGSTPRAIEVMSQGIHTNNMDTNVWGRAIAGTPSSPVNVLVDTNTVSVNTNNQLYVPGQAETLFGAGTNGGNTNLTLSTSFTNLNGQFQLRGFTSTNVNFSSGTAQQIVLPHGLGATPSVARWVMVCVTSELGYNIGDELDTTSAVDNGFGTAHFTTSCNATNVMIVMDNNTISILGTNQSSATITSGKWKLKAYARP